MHPSYLLDVILWVAPIIQVVIQYTYHTNCSECLYILCLKLILSIQFSDGLYSSMSLMQKDGTAH